MLKENLIPMADVIVNGKSLREWTEYCTINRFNHMGRCSLCKESGNCRFFGLLPYEYRGMINKYYVAETNGNIIVLEPNKE